MTAQVNSVYLEDGESKIDGVLTYDVSKECSEIDSFLKNLEEIGVVLKSVAVKPDPRLIFVKMHVPTKVLEKYAAAYDITLSKDRNLELPDPKVYLPCLDTILSVPKPNPNHPTSKRAWKTVSKEKPTEIETCERIVILFMILDTVEFTDDTTVHVGIGELLMKKLILDVFPLHDGPFQWPEPDDGGPLNDRQLLAKYWASHKMMFKKQPLHTIKKYFGYECGIYFCWLGYYNQMLLYASLMGIVTFISGCIVVDSFYKHHLEEFCNKTATMCNRALTEAKLTHYDSANIKSNCILIYLSFANSNLATFIYSVGIIIWCTIFKEGWKRKMNVYNVKWDHSVFEDYNLRPQFKANPTNKIRIHKYTGEPELYLPAFEQFVRFTVSILCTVVMISIAILSVYVVYIIEHYLLIAGYNRIQMIILTSFCSLMFMIILEFIFNTNFSSLLAQFELPQTNLDYEKSIIVKSSVFLFINSYGRLMYIAFLKGSFYPGDFEYASENCLPPNCVFEVCFLLAMVLILKPIIVDAIEVMKTACQKQLQKYTLSNEKVRPRWEWDHALSPMDCRYISNVLNTKIVQFGMITFFSASFPLGPLIVLMHNTITLRSYAKRIVKMHKRPVERKRVSSIGVCFAIFENMTFVAIIINAIFTAYTTNLAHIFYDYHTNAAILNSTESCAASGPHELSDVYTFYEYQEHDSEKCYLPYRYDLCKFDDKTSKCYSLEHYDLLAFKSYLALGFLLLSFLGSGIISYSIPDVPRELEELLYYDEQKERLKDL